MAEAFNGAEEREKLIRDASGPAGKVDS
jgi:hypothetical protein